MAVQAGDQGTTTGHALAQWLQDELKVHRSIPDQLADQLGVERKRVRRWTKGAKAPNRNMCKRLAGVIGAEEERVLLLAGHDPRPAKTRACEGDGGTE